MTKNTPVSRSTSRSMRSMTAWMSLMSESFGTSTSSMAITLPGAVTVGYKIVAAHNGGGSFPQGR
jgi:hypothetical protein